ncbi:metallophosphoesterase family protein [Methylolobus aquaticus]
MTVCRVGLIADTHGLLRLEAVSFLRGCDHIIHAGDIGGPELLAVLRDLAPVTAVRGNNDRGPWADDLPDRSQVVVGGVTIHVLHDLAALDLSPASRVVVSGHSHRPSVVERDGVLYVNPGSAGRRRFKLPVAVGELWLDGDEISSRIITLDCATDPLNPLMLREGPGRRDTP